MYLSRSDYHTTRVGVGPNVSHQQHTFSDNVCTGNINCFIFKKSLIKMSLPLTLKLFVRQIALVLYRAKGKFTTRGHFPYCQII